MKNILLTLMFIGMASAYNVTLSHSYNYTEFTSYFTGFYDDWSPYALTIMAFGLSFLLSDRYSQTFNLTGLGMAFLFFATGNGIFAAGAVVLFVTGWIMKYIIG